MLTDKLSRGECLNLGNECWNGRLEADTTASECVLVFLFARARLCVDAVGVERVEGGEVNPNIFFNQISCLSAKI